MAQHMIAYVLNQDLETLDIVDGYESFIWTERFNECGDFSLTVTPDSHVLNSLIYPNYLMLKGSNSLMCIEDYELNQKWQEGDFVTVTGRTIDSILDTRRVYYPLTFDNATVQTCLETILNQNVLSPSMVERKYSYIQYGGASPRTTSTQYTGEFFGEDVLEAVQTLCGVADCGIQMLPDYTTRKFVLSFYDGTDRSTSQDIIPPVVFSPKYENLIGAKYYKSPLSLANAAVIHGEDLEVKTVSGEEEITTNVPMYAYVGNSSLRDRDRIEISIENTGLSSKRDDENSYSEAEYKKLLEDAANTELSTYKVTETFSGDVEPLRQFVYGRDFFLGDIVQVMDDYGHDGKLRVSEVVQSEDSNGYLITPTFVAL